MLLHFRFKERGHASKCTLGVVVWKCNAANLTLTSAKWNFQAVLCMSCFYFLMLDLTVLQFKYLISYQGKDLGNTKASLCRMWANQFDFIGKTWVISSLLTTVNYMFHFIFPPSEICFFFNTSIKYYLLCYLLLTQNCLTIRAIKVLSNCKSHLPKHFSFHKHTEVKLGFSILAKHTLTCRPEKPGIKLPTLWLAENLPYQVSHIRASFPTFIYFLYASLLLWRL